ncbi:MAG: PEP/pyruvate-binding domain-containing protein [bacterium]|jgi:phosphoenolpyruvate synthase/pyruvate phosphate dikinase
MPDAGRIATFLSFNPSKTPFYSSRTIGEGKVGGKARGLLFAREILLQSSNPILTQVSIPESYFLATGVFDAFLATNDLQGFAESGRDYTEIEAAFLRGSFSVEVRERLGHLLREFDCPLAVRSSSLLEDNLKYSFAGKYLTTFVSNRGDLETRLAALEQAVKRVLASTFAPNAVEYRRKHGLHGDKMAVLIQRLVGKDRGGYFYPETAGVGFSKTTGAGPNGLRKKMA